MQKYELGTEILNFDVIKLSWTFDQPLETKSTAPSSRKSYAGLEKIKERNCLTPSRPQWFLIVYVFAYRGFIFLKLWLCCGEIQIYKWNMHVWVFWTYLHFNIFSVMSLLVKSKKGPKLDQRRKHTWQSSYQMNDTWYIIISRGVFKNSRNK